MFLLELGLLSPWLPIENENVFLLELGLLSSLLPVESEKCFFISAWLLSSHGVCFWTTIAMKGKRKWKFEIGKNAR